MSDDSFDIFLEEGVPYEFEVYNQNDDGEVVPFPTGSTAKMQVRAEADPDSEIVLELTSSSGLTIDTDAGTLSGKITVAAGLDIPRGKTFVHDCFVFPPGAPDTADPIKQFRGVLRKILRVTVP